MENARAWDGQDVVDRALQKHVSVNELAWTMTRFANAAGATAARQALDVAAEGTVSPPERKLLAALRRAGLNEVKAGVHVRVGHRRFWLDFAVEHVKLAIEVDGVSAHSDPATFHSDRARQNALVRDQWTVLRYTPWQIRTDLAAAVAEISAVLRNPGG